MASDFIICEMMAQINQVTASKGFAADRSGREMGTGFLWGSNPLQPQKNLPHNP